MISLVFEMCDFKECQAPKWSPGFEWFFSRAPRAMDFANCMDKQSDNLWVECLHLHVLHMLNHDVPRRIKDVMRFSASLFGAFHASLS